MLPRHNRQIVSIPEKRIDDANRGEKKAMIELLGKLPSPITNRMDHLMLDKGYDSTDMIRAG